VRAQRDEKAPVDTLAAEIGRRIRAVRLERGMSLADLGGNDLTRSFLSQVELGRSRISLKALALVAERLGMPISHFLDDTLEARDGSAELAVDRARLAAAVTGRIVAHRAIGGRVVIATHLPIAVGPAGRLALDDFAPASGHPLALGF